MDEFKSEVISRGSLKKTWIMPDDMTNAAYCFRETTEGDDVIEEDMPLSSLPSLTAALEAKPPRFPVLFLVDRANQNRLDFVQALSSLLEHSISDCSEARDFRSDMVQFRQSGVFTIDDVEYPVSLAHTPYSGAELPANITVKVFHAGKTNSSKLARLQPAMSTTQAIEEVVKKMQLVIDERNRDRPVTSWILKVTGRHEFIFGSQPLIDHRYIRACLIENKEISLKLLLRVDESKKLPKNRRHSVVMTSQIASVGLPSSSLSTISETSDLPDSSPIQGPGNGVGSSHSGLGSISPQSDAAYRISLVDICVPNSLLDKVDKLTGEQRSVDSLGGVFCEFGVIFGTEPLWNGMKVTPDFRLSASTDSVGQTCWVAAASDHTVTFDSLPISQIPFGSRVTCTIYYRSKGKDSVLGGLTFAVYTHNRILECGSQPHAFWSFKHSKANPLSVVMHENKKIGGACSIKVKFTSASEPIAKALSASRDYTPPLSFQKPRPDSQNLPLLMKIVSADALSVLSMGEKALLWEHRHWAMDKSTAFCKVFQCVDWTVPEQEIEILSMMKEWAPLSHQDALGLLDACYAHPAVREHAVEALSTIDDEYLLGIMLQLTQALKYEPYHQCALVRFLLRRALKNRKIGHRLFWYLKAEIHQIEIQERFGLIIEAYLHACGDFRRDIFRENKVLNDLTAVGSIIKTIPATERLQKLRHELSLIQFPNNPEGFLIPTDFGVRVKGLVVEKCKYMDSKKLPLWLVFQNADPDGANVLVIFKVGDDLRQDILTLQMITLMYKQVEDSSLALDLRMRPYAVVATGRGLSPTA